MHKKNIEITLNSYLPSLLTGIKNQGIKPEQFIKSSYLKKLDLYDPNKYIPNVLLDELLISITDKLGTNSLATNFNEHFKSTKMGDVSNHLFKSPNFLSFLESVIKYSKIIRSNYTAKLVINGSISKFSVKINETNSKGKLISEEIDIVRILDAFVLVGGKNYTPIKLGITASSSYHLESVFPKGNYSIDLNQEESWILFNTSMLSKKIPDLFDNLPTIRILKNSQVIEYTIERLIESFKPSYIPRPEELSEMLNISRRTLERNLQKEGTHYLKIKRRFLQRKSYELLSEQNLSIKEIAEQLDYSNSQNFIRSFKKLNGTTPSKYRLSL